MRQHDCKHMMKMASESRDIIVVSLGQFETNIYETLKSRYLKKIEIG